MRGGYGGLEVPGVDQLAANGDIVELPGPQIADALAVSIRPEVLMLAQHPHSPRPLETRCGLGEVVADLLPRRTLVVAAVLAALVDPVPAQGQRIDSVFRRGVAADERVGVQPVTTRPGPRVDQGHLDVRLGPSVSANARPLAPAPTTR